MAKKASKVIVDARGNVLLRRASGHHNRIGRIEKIVDGAWRSCATSPPSPSGNPYCSMRKTKAAAVLNIVNHWRSWIGLPRGHTNY